MKWTRRGLIFSASGQFGWMNSHAQVPTPIVVDDIIRIFFASRKENNESKISFLDVRKDDPREIVYIHEKPILLNGPPGSFDEHGLMPSSIYKYKDIYYLYYSGWSRRTSVPYSNLTGIAKSKDCIKFEKIFEGPILSTNKLEPFSATSPCVQRLNNDFLMFYCSGTDWIKINGKFEHTYDIKLARSRDCLNWTQNGKTIIPQSSKKEAITRPFLMINEDSYYMFYCFRGSDDFRDGLESYKIGYSYSRDLVEWIRKDNVNFEGIQENWESNMMAYPSILSNGEKTYMFYNGNGFGKAGFGFAELSR